MSIKFSQYDNKLEINNNKIVFDYDIRYVVETNDILIILLEIPNNVIYLNNVFGVNKGGKVKWRIQNVNDVFNIKNQLPFENLMINETGVYVSDFYGRRFSLNPITGKVLSNDIVR